MASYVSTLFLGGPLHEQSMPLDTSLSHYLAIDDPHAFVTTNPGWITTPRTTVYRRERMATGDVDKVRSVMVLDSIPIKDAERMLMNYLCRRWIEQSPDTH